MVKNNYKNDTKNILAGKRKKITNSFVNSPIYRGSTILFDNVEEMQSKMKRKNTQTLFYGRFGSPATFEFESAIADIDEAHSAVATSSGTAAIAASLLAVLKTGDHVLMTDSVYDASRNLTQHLLKNMGVTTTFYHPNIGNNIQDLITSKTKLIFMESPGSLTFEIQNISLLVEIAKKNRLITIIDNTWATSLFFKPIKYGVDICIQSATKYIVGHSDAMLGVITTNRKYSKCVRESVHNLGSCPGPDDIYLGLRGIKSLSIRLLKHQENAFKIIEWLLKQKEVYKILYPALKNDPGYDLWKKDFKGASGLFGVILKNTNKKLIYKMLNNLKLLNMGFSWGGYESLILPVNPEKTRNTYKWGHKNLTLRIHAGLEDPDDIIYDLKSNFYILRKN